MQIKGVNEEVFELNLEQMYRKNLLFEYFNLIRPFNSKPSIYQRIWSFLAYLKCDSQNDIL